MPSAAPIRPFMQFTDDEGRLSKEAYDFLFDLYMRFYNPTAVNAAVATTGATNVAPYGFTTAAQADAIVALLNQLRAVQVADGFAV